MKPLSIQVKLLLNRVTYDPNADLAVISEFFLERGVALTFIPVNTNITGYTTVMVTNPFGNEQPVVSGAEPLVVPFLEPSDDICCLVIEGFKEFGLNCPSESEQRSFIPGTKTVFLTANADDPFYDQVPNFQIWLQHELMHALGTLSEADGFPVVDCMDMLIAPNGQKLYYFLNYSPDDVNSNHTNMWERLNPWLKAKGAVV